VQAEGCKVDCRYGWCNDTPGPLCLPTALVPQPGSALHALVTLGHTPYRMQACAEATRLCPMVAPGVPHLERYIAHTALMRHPHDQHHTVHVALAQAANGPVLQSTLRDAAAATAPRTPGMQPSRAWHPARGARKGHVSGPSASILVLGLGPKPEQLHHVTARCSAQLGLCCQICQLPVNKPHPSAHATHAVVHLLVNC